MLVIVFNVGSSSLKFGVFRVDDEAREVLKGSYERFRDGVCEVRIRHEDMDDRWTAECDGVSSAIAEVPALLDRFGLSSIEAVGHRVAHGGALFAAPTILDEATIARIETLTPLAPLHNPANLEAIALSRRLWPEIPQVAVFDTSFHLSNPPFATTYAVPKAWRDAGLRRYGFHGTSHKYVATRVAEEIGIDLADLRIASVHLGNGASICAVNRGVSMDSSMGMTPLEGLVMGTRSGDVDPGAFGHLSRQLGLSIAEVEDALYSQSGLKGLAGSADMRDLEDAATGGDADAQLAIEIYAYRARKYIGAYAAAMAGLDAIVFTGGIGENSPSMRRRILDGLEFMGVRLDHERNQVADLSGRAAPQIQAYGSRVRVLVTETAEQMMIARETAEALARPKPSNGIIAVAVSGRHVHLSRAAVDALFGAGYVLTPETPLRQPGNWAARERVVVKGPKGKLERVAILGPLRARTQVEISRTDSFVLGIDVPVRDSGKLDDTPSVTLVGPAGTVETEGLILAARHIHTNPADAARLGLENGDHVDVHVGDDSRGLTFARTLIRIGANSFTEMHIDTDEANAAGIGGAAEGQIVAGATATIRANHQ
ncbi:acetate/propionate family kinase [Rhizobium metallidurans]|uniref:Acetate kinase n=1 Tax=Rhizobium metallidurans TaxID=1265931 RepID=A0A7W6CTF0_9HYPH|nr:acetate/propionate family kinase [Rhizobium metallidurans]MBB3965879.1 acetate kinase [Rhizobium metallidurans]